MSRRTARSRNINNGIDEETSELEVPRQVNLDGNNTPGPDNGGVRAPGTNNGGAGAEVPGTVNGGTSIRAPGTVIGGVATPGTNNGGAGDVDRPGLQYRSGQNMGEGFDYKATEHMSCMFNRSLPKMKCADELESFLTKFINKLTGIVQRRPGPAIKKVDLLNWLTGKRNLIDTPVDIDQIVSNGLCRMVNECVNERDSLLLETQLDLHAEHNDELLRPGTAAFRVLWEYALVNRIKTRSIYIENLAEMKFVVDGTVQFQVFFAGFKRCANIAYAHNFHTLAQQQELSAQLFRQLTGLHLRERNRLEVDYEEWCRSKGKQNTLSNLYIYLLPLLKGDSNIEHQALVSEMPGKRNNSRRKGSRGKLEKMNTRNRRKDVKCWLCDKVGHYKSNCPDLKQVAAVAEVESDYSYSLEDDDFNCFVTTMNTVSKE